jgi:signal transduction histidine kinase/CheY-like chemotaxis protein
VRYTYHDARVQLHAITMGLALMDDELRAAQQDAEAHADGGGGGTGSTQAAALLTPSRRQSASLPTSELPPPRYSDEAVGGMSVGNGQHGALSRRFDELRCLLSTLRDGADAMAGVFNSVLTMASIEANAFTIQLAPADIGATVAAAVRQLQPWAARLGAELQLQLADDLPPKALFDHVKLGQAVSNFVSNALKNLRTHVPGRVLVRVHRVERKDDDTTGAVQEPPPRVRVEIVDNGVGLTTEQQARLFKPFAQVAHAAACSNGSLGSSGLGLAITAEVLARHGGAVGVDSRAGEGSTFWFELPLPPPQPMSYEEPSALEAPNDAAAAASGATTSGGGAVRRRRRPSSRKQQPYPCPILAAPSAAPTAGDEPGQATPCSPLLPRGLRILVVEDSDTVRRLTLRSLRGKLPDAVIDTAEDGRRALDMFATAFGGVKGEDGSEEGNRGSRRQPYDVVLMDRSMPIVCGLAAARALRSGDYSCVVTAISGADSVGTTDGATSLRTCYPPFRGVILGVTGDALEDDVQDFRAAGLDGVLTKPVSVDEVLSAIRAHTDAGCW